MKTQFNAYLQNVLAIAGKSLADAATMSHRAFTAHRKEAAKQCIANLATIRTLRIEREKRALEAQASQMGMNSAPVAPPLAELPKATSKTFNITQTFGLAGCPPTATFTAKNHNPKHPMVPKADPDYVFHNSNVSDVLSFLQIQGDTLMMIYGPTGCGKTSVLDEIAARLGIPVYGVVAHNRMETPELFGGYKLNKEGGMDWIPGPITLAAKHDCWCVINEADLLDPAALAGLNGVADGNPFLIPETSEQVIPGPNFRLFMTTNTNGSGDASGMYQGTLRMNMAFVDRAYMAQFRYLPEPVEIGILEKAAPSMLPEIRKKMVVFANEVRALFVKGETEVTLSTRTLVRWAKAASFFTSSFETAPNAPNPLAHAFDRSLAYRVEGESRLALKELYQRHFN